MKYPLDLALYLVTNRGVLSNEDFFRIIRQSIDGGVKIVQLREKDTPACEMIALGKSLRSFLKPLGIPLIINDRVDVAHAVHADGVHLGQTDLKIAEARAILGPQAIIGLSVGTHEQMLAALDEDVTYLSVGPVFFTKTKPNCGKPCGLDGLTHLCSISRHPVIGIGGIDETNVGQVLECGVVGVAVVSAIFNASCPKTAALAITNRMKQWV